MRRRLALALAAITGASLLPLLREPTPLARPIDCDHAITVGGVLWCGPGVPERVPELCRRVGLPTAPGLAARDLHPGDAVDPVGVCLGGRAPSRMPPRALAALGLPVNVNEARAGELASLPGVGPITAQQIVQGRPFATVDELDRVRGIGPKRLAGLRARARVRWAAPEAQP